MHNNNRGLLSKTIRQTILSIERPFNTVDLFFVLEKDHNIQDRDLILDILDELFEIGVVCYSEIKDGCWAFRVSS